MEGICGVSIIIIVLMKIDLVKIFINLKFSLDRV